MENLSRVLWDLLQGPRTTEVIRRTLAAGVVLDTWMNGEEEAEVSAAAEALLAAAADELAATALATGAMFPSSPMPPPYVRAAVHELLFSTALYAAQKSKGSRHVDESDVKEAQARIRRLAERPEGLTELGYFFFLVSAHEDLNAIAYYGRMAVDDFLHGTLHRPWSNTVLTAQLQLYRRMGLVDQVFTGTGDRLAVTRLGVQVLEQIHDRLDQSGELQWRAENQRWVIFGETNYDAVFSRILPDANAQTLSYLQSLGLKPGMRILEVGCGTGRATVDLGLYRMVEPGGTVTALDPSRLLLNRLAQKCEERRVANVELVQGVAEALPFEDSHFDAVVAVLALHFTDVDRALGEMVRVAKPGGLVSALSPAPEFDIRKIPMVAMWFRPLSDLADRFGIPFAERNGLPVGVLQEAFARHLTNVSMRDIPAAVDAGDYRSFLAFVLRGAAFFQNILSRLPYQERWAIMARLEQTGAELVKSTAPEEQRALYSAEAAYGWKAPADQQDTNTSDL